MKNHEDLHQHLVEQWDTAWEGDGWHASWTKALGDLSAIQAAWLPDKARHSIWQIVNHVIFWRNVTLNTAEGLPRPSDAECERKNFEAPADISEDAWSITKQSLEDSYRALRPILEGKKPGFDRAKNHVTHDAYHLGQIMQLRALQGMKSIVQREFEVMLDLPVAKHLEAHPYPLLFVTISGAHLYGFESANSDWDLRGCHITPVREVSRLSPPSETYEVMDKDAPIEVDLVTHDVKKFFTLLLKNNGYVLEQVCSPLVVQSAPEFAELRALAPRCITKFHHHHFRAFGQNQWEMVVKGGKPTVKGLLYTYRVLLAGIHLMRSGEVESNLRRLNENFKLPHIDDLIAKKISGDEKQTLAGENLTWHEREFTRLCADLDAAREASKLPEQPTCRAEIDDLLVRLRLKHLN